MTVTDSPAPMPDASRFSARNTTRAWVTYTTDPSTWAERDEAEIETFPAESRWTVEFPPGSGMYCTIVRQGRDGSFSLLARHGIYARHLAGTRMAERVPIDPCR